MGPHRISAIAAVVTLTAATAIGLLTPLVLGAMVDAVTEADGDAVSRIGTLTLALVGIAVASSLLVGVSNYLLAGVGERVVADLREEVVVRVLDLPQSDVERAGRGDLVSRITGDVRLVTRAVSEALPVFATAALTIVLTLIGLGSLDWRFAVAAVIAAPIQIPGAALVPLEVGTGLPRGAGGRRCTCATAPGLAEQLRHRRIASPGRVASRTDRISIYGRRPPELVDHASTHQVLRPAQHRGVHRSVRRADHWLLAGERRADQHRCRHSRSPVLPPPLRSGGRSSQCVRRIAGRHNSVGSPGRSHPCARAIRTDRSAGTCRQLSFFGTRHILVPKRRRSCSARHRHHHSGRNRHRTGGRYRSRKIYSRKADRGNLRTDRRRREDRDGAPERTATVDISERGGPRDSGGPRLRRHVGRGSAAGRPVGNRQRHHRGARYRRRVGLAAGSPRADSKPWSETVDTG